MGTTTRLGRAGGNHARTRRPCVEKQPRTALANPGGGSSRSPYCSASACAISVYALAIRVFSNSDSHRHWSTSSRRCLTDTFPSFQAVLVSAADHDALDDSGERTGLTVDVQQDSQVFEFLRRLPDASLIAGWPSDETVDSIPFLTRRSAFVTYETHQAFHQAYLDEMRRRMRALIDAIFATDPAPLVRLRDDWGVTYLIVDLRYYGPSPPTYFKPFDGWIRVAVERGRDAGFELPRQIKPAAVFSHGSLSVLDLRQLSLQRRSKDR
jgi:hypothetical protein